jgi:hypothetical protein
MARARSCTYQHADGRPCRAPPLEASSRCYWHAPEKAEELAEARRLGGLRRRKEKTVAVAYDLVGLRSVTDIQRVLDILLIDALSLENTPARGRLLNGLLTTALRLHELARFEQRDSDS